MLSFAQVSGDVKPEYNHLAKDPDVFGPVLALLLRRCGPKSAKQCLTTLVPVPVHSKCCLLKRIPKVLRLLTGDTDPTIACLDGV